MMQSAEAWERNHRGVLVLLRLDWPPERCILCQRIVNPVLIMIIHVFLKQAEKVAFVKRNSMIQHLTATASDPALRRSVLPGRLHARPFRFQAGGLQEGDDRIIKLCIVIEDHMLIRPGFPQRLGVVAERPRPLRDGGSH